MYRLAENALRAAIAQEAEAFDRELRARLRVELGGDGEALARMLAGAPSVGVARHLWRALDAAWRDATHVEGSALEVTVFAVPLVIVAGREGAGDAGVLAGTLADPSRLAEILREHGALAATIRSRCRTRSSRPKRSTSRGCRQSLPLPVARFACGRRALVAARVPAGTDGVPLRAGGRAPALSSGVAMARPGAALTADTTVGKWGVAFTRELTVQLATEGASVLALPRAAQRPLPAVAAGRAAQREVAAQIFASNAIRKFRATVGEPTAVISAHRAPDAPGGGELRLSLSSPFEPRDAEGFRCPLYPLDRASDGRRHARRPAARLPGDRRPNPGGRARRPRRRHGRAALVQAGLDPRRSRVPDPLRRRGRVAALHLADAAHLPGDFRIADVFHGRRAERSRSSVLSRPHHDAARAAHRHPDRVAGEVRRR
jgi:hypothetical protein